MKKVIAVLALVLLASFNVAQAATLTFNQNSSGASYTENGMTITSTGTTNVNTNGSWYLTIGGQDSFELTTGGVFDLLSVNTLHYDYSETTLWQGFSNGQLIASTTTNAADTLWNFLGFVNLDKVAVTMTGYWNDPSFDNLTYQSSVSAVPVPAAVWLFGSGIAGLIGASKRKKTVAAVTA